jgi:hypothetical protein
MIDGNKRSFLKKIFFFEKKNEFSDEYILLNQTETKRRNFLKFLGLLSLSLAPGMSRAEKKEIKKDLNELEEIKNIPDEEIEESHMETFGENMIVTFAQIISVKMLQIMGFKDVGHASADLIEERLKEIPIDTTLKIVIKAPVIEELIYRLLPNLFLPTGKTSMWEVGIPINLIFAYMHNYEHDDKGNKKFNSKNIPLPQFIGGCFYWYLIRHKGISHSILAHSSSNLIALVYALLEMDKK